MWSGAITIDAFDLTAIECASLARIRTLGPVKVREFVCLFLSCIKAMYMEPYGTKVVPKIIG